MKLIDFNSKSVIRILIQKDKCIFYDLYMIIII